MSVRTVAARLIPLGAFVAAPTAAAGYEPPPHKFHNWTVEQANHRMSATEEFGNARCRGLGKPQHDARFGTVYSRFRCRVSGQGAPRGYDVIVTVRPYSVREIEEDIFAPAKAKEKPRR